MYRNRNIGKKCILIINYKYICNFKSVHILDSINKCHYNVLYASVTMCQQLLTVNLDEELNSSKCNLSLEPKMMTVH